MKASIEKNIAELYPSIYRICLGYTAGKEEARDLVQDVYERIWRSRDSFRGESALSTWVYRVTVNTCLMHRRKRKLTIVPLPEHHDPAAPDAVADDQLTALQGAIRQLPVRDRLLIMLHLEENTYAEIADVLGISVSNVGARLSRLRKQLQQSLKTQLT